MKAYDKRCSNLSGVFHANCLYAGSVISGSGLRSLYDIGMLFGTGLQAANDLGDLALPTEEVGVMEKPYNDQFSDLKQGKLTLPVYLLLTRVSSEIRSQIESRIGEELEEKECEEVVAWLFQTGSFDVCIENLREKHRQAKQSLYNHFDRDSTRDLIAQMLSAIIYNKFITSLRNYGSQ